MQDESKASKVSISKKSSTLEKPESSLHPSGSKTSKASKTSASKKSSTLEKIEIPQHHTASKASVSKKSSTFEKTESLQFETAQHPSESKTSVSKKSSAFEKPDSIQFETSPEPPSEPKHLSFKTPKHEIRINDTLPYGVRLFQDTPENVVRMKDIGQNKRILLIGVLGSFTPDCWNRHLFQILQKLNYFGERNVNHICCISTNDAFTYAAWGKYLGCDKKILMWSDSTTKFTNSLGMCIFIPWLDSSIRSRRYVILADDMVVKKMITAPDHHARSGWFCEHLTKNYTEIGEDE